MYVAGYLQLEDALGCLLSKFSAARGLAASALNACTYLSKTPNKPETPTTNRYNSIPPQWIRSQQKEVLQNPTPGFLHRCLPLRCSWTNPIAPQNLSTFTMRSTRANTKPWLTSIPRHSRQRMHYLLGYCNYVPRLPSGKQKRSWQMSRRKQQTSPT